MASATKHHGIVAAIVAAAVLMGWLFAEALLNGANAIGLVIVVALAGVLAWLIPLYRRSFLARARTPHDAQWTKDNNGGGTLSVDVTNTGACQGTEVVQLYIRDLSDKEGPLKSLRGFKKVQLKPGQTTTATIALDKKSFEFWDAETNTMRTKPGQYELFYGTSSADKDLQKMTVELKN